MIKILLIFGNIFLRLMVVNLFIECIFRYEQDRK